MDPQPNLVNINGDPGIAQSTNIEVSAEVFPTRILELHSPFPTEASAYHQEYLGGHFGYRLQRPPQTTISTGAVPDPTALIQELQHLTIYSGAVPGYNLTCFDEAVSMVYGLEQLPYRLDEHRPVCMNKYGQGELCLSISYVFHRDAQLSGDTDFDQAVTQCLSDEFILYLNALSSTGSQDDHASAEPTSLQSEALSQHQYDSSASHRVSLRTFGDCSLGDLFQVPFQSSSSEGAVPDPNVYDPGQLQFTISRGAIPVFNIDWSQTFRLFQTTGEQVVVSARRDVDEDLWKRYSQSDVEDFDTLSRFDFSAMGSAPTTLQYQNIDISTKVEQSEGDPLPFLNLSTVSIDYRDLPSFPCDTVRTIWAPANILQDTVIFSDKNRHRLHQEPLQDTTFRGAVLFLIWCRIDLLEDALHRFIHVVSQLWPSAYLEICNCHLVCK